MDNTLQIAIFAGYKTMPGKDQIKTARRLFVAIVCVLITFGVNAQYYKNSQTWKSQRAELTFGLGVTNFLGELGGRDQIGSPFLWDLELTETKPAISFGYRYYVGRKQSIRTVASYGILSGNDNLTEEPFRRNRNLHFKSDLIETSVCYEIHLFQEELGHSYSLRGVKGKRSARVGLYAFAGVGGIYFNPKAQVGNTWVALRPLNTEGQGLVQGVESYSNFSIVIPVGAGLRYSLNKYLSVGLETQYTKTFTDYIDDVSTDYADPAILAAQPNGQLAVALANPSLDFLPPATTAPGQQRGDPKDNDAYLFFKLTMHYKLFSYRANNKRYRTRIRRQKIVF